MNAASAAPWSLPDCHLTAEACPSVSTGRPTLYVVSKSAYTYKLELDYLLSEHCHERAQVTITSSCVLTEAAKQANIERIKRHFALEGIPLLSIRHVNESTIELLDMQAA